MFAGAVSFGLSVAAVQVSSISASLAEPTSSRPLATA
jgi:hypothetical protein